MNFLHDPRLQLITALLLATILSVFLIRRVLRRTTHQLHARAPNEERHFLAELVRCAIGPVSLLAWYYALYAIAHVVLVSEWVPRDWTWVQPTLRHSSWVGVFLAFLWFFDAATRLADHRLRRVATRTQSRFDDIFLPLLGTALRVTVPILAVFLFVRLWPLSAAGMDVARKLLAIALIAAITWVLRRAILLSDRLVLGADHTIDPTTAEHRALFTRIRMLQRIALVMISLFALAAVLMMFQEVRVIGRSILASAGIAGIVLGIAAQRTLGNLFAGIQIALTQPVRLGDQVIVEGDFASIEEITLTYVIARTWDSRRIVLPISYFIEKPFQNWTRGTPSLLAPLVLQVDFSLPMDEFRAFMQQEIAKSEFWDKQVFGVQVSDSDERTMQVRVLGSAPDAGSAWNLRCELREKAIDFIRRHHPESLPKLRLEQNPVEEWPPAADGRRRRTGQPPAPDRAPQRAP